MYKRYKLQNDQKLEELIHQYKAKGEEIIKSKKWSVENSLKDYLNQDGCLDMCNLSEDWFPKVECDVFLSHSHKDLETVKGLVGFFKECFNIDVFVDSYVWGYCNDLLREIDNKYCVTEDLYYDYNKRNYSTAHVHMMLSNSLNEMINKSECIIFLESDNSLNVEDVVNKGTSSPWIYSELISTKLMKITIPERILEENRKAYFEQTTETAQDFKPMYRVEISHLEDLTVECLKNVSDRLLTNKNDYLDEIYKMSQKSIGE